MPNLEKQKKGPSQYRDDLNQKVCVEKKPCLSRVSLFTFLILFRKKVGASLEGMPHQKEEEKIGKSLLGIRTLITTTSQTRGHD